MHVAMSPAIAVVSCSSSEELAVDVIQPHPDQDWLFSILWGSEDSGLPALNIRSTKAAS